MENEKLATLLDVFTDDSYKEKMEELDSKISEYGKLVKAKGGIDKINSLLIQAASKIEIANTILGQAKEQKEKILFSVSEKAKDIETVSKERSAKIIYLAEEKLRKANKKEDELKKLKVELDKEKEKLKRKEKAIQKTEKSIVAREEIIKRKELILDQL